ncbi:MAG: phosphoribosylanthranilate isomerase [Lachnospiraceae bacterium]|nr:phosphoribosylanthranilate isomerase [Lachnospiraceae bacterium]
MQNELKVKICGLRTREDAEAVNEVQPDFAGFIFVEGRKRYIVPEKAEKIRRTLAPGIRSVGVFLDDPIEKIISYHRACPFDLIQLHGAENNDYIEELREELGGIPIIKAFRIDSKEAVTRVSSCTADYLLLDNGIGGTGERFDWSLIQGLTVPFFLAGGISAENVGEAVRLLDPFGVDVSSSLETDGRKDPKKLREFMAIVRERK